MPDIKIQYFLQAVVATDHLVSSPPQIVDYQRVFDFHPSFQARIIFDHSLPLVPGCFPSLMWTSLPHPLVVVNYAYGDLTPNGVFLELALHRREFIVTVCVLRYAV